MYREKNKKTKQKQTNREGEKVNGNFCWQPLLPVVLGGNCALRHNCRAVSVLTSTPANYALGANNFAALI